MEQFYFLKQIPETRSDVRHRQTAGVRRESERAQQQRPELVRKHTLTEMCSGGQ